MSLSIALALIVLLLYLGGDVHIPVSLLSLYLLLEGSGEVKRAITLFCLTLLFSFAAEPLYYLTDFSAGFDRGEIARVTGVAVSDSTRGKYFQNRFSLKVLECNDRRGGAATGRGVVSATVPGDVEVLTGDTLVIDGKFSEYGFNGRRAFIKERPRYNEVRRRVLEGLDGLLQGNEEEKTLSKLLLLGVSEDPEFPLTALSRESGTSYVLALSGMHIGFFSLFLSLLLRPLFGRRGAKALCLIVLALYVAIIGVKPSLVRALLLSLCFFLFPDNKGIENLAITLLLQTVLLPETVISLSAAFSYISLCGILGFSPFFKERLDGIVLLPEAISSALSASISAILYTVPFTLHVFGSYQLSALFTGSVISLLIYIYMLLSLLCCFSPGFLGPLRLTYKAIEGCMGFGAAVPLQNTLTPYIAFLFAILLIILLSVILDQGKRRACGIWITTALRNLKWCLKRRSLQ